MLYEYIRVWAKFEKNNNVSEQQSANACLICVCVFVEHV